MITHLIERHEEKINMVYTCLDRVIIKGTLPSISWSGGMESYLSHKRILFKDFTKWAKTRRDEIISNAQLIAEESGVSIEYLANSNVKMNERIDEILAKRGDHPGMVHVFSRKQECRSFKVNYAAGRGKPEIRIRLGYFLHYYFYFIDKDYGLCHFRVCTAAPFDVQFYFNGHHVLARRLRKEGIEFTQDDNVFLDFGNTQEAQRLANDISVKTLHQILDHYGAEFCPPSVRIKSGYHWSLHQIECATNVVFNKEEKFEPIYENLVQTAAHSVKAEDIAAFVDRKLHGGFKCDIGGRFDRFVDVWRVKHALGPVSIKMYNKKGLVLRVETTSNNVSFFKHRREVRHRDGTSEVAVAPVKKSIYSLQVVRRLLADSNRRYLDFVSAMEDPCAGITNLRKITKRVRVGKRGHRGFNMFLDDDLHLFEALSRGEFNISGFTNKRLRQHLPGKSSSQAARMIKRLRTHGMARKVGRSYKYYLTNFGRNVITTALKVNSLVIIPELALA